MESEELQSLLGLARQFLTGELPRSALKGRSSREKVFVGTAIMLAVGEPYFLGPGNEVFGAYATHLETLTDEGVVNPYDPDELHTCWSGRMVLRDAAIRMKMYQPTPGRGHAKTIRLTPPPELTALVDSIGHTPALDAFLEDVAASPERRQRWKTESAVQQQAEKPDPACDNHPDVYFNTVIMNTQQNYGTAGLRRLRTLIEKALPGH